MASKDSVIGTIRTALILCVVCSIFISSAAVILKPFQDANVVTDRNKNILAAAGLFDASIHTSADVANLFSQFEARVVDMDEGRFLTDEELAQLQIDPATYDQRAYLNDASFSESIPSEEDIASLKRRVRYSTVYLVAGDNGELETMVLPVSGYGLWGTMYGYLALESDLNTVVGIGFYEQKETPGLGGEIVNPRWVGQWPGKKIYDAEGDVALELVKSNAQGEHQVDGLAGATLTTRGVDYLIDYWMGPQGFGPFLANLRES